MERIMDLLPRKVTWGATERASATKKKYSNKTDKGTHRLEYGKGKGKQTRKVNKEVGKERKGEERKERKGKERKGKERKGKERKGKERKGKERKGKERKGNACDICKQA
jgi:hypothetical protein